MDWQNLLDGFQFKNHFILDQKIDAKSGLQPHRFVR